MTNMWMVRAGEQAFLIEEFLKNNIVAIGWDLGDLSAKNDDEIAELYKKKYKNTRSLNQVLRFKNEISIGDYVLSAKGSVGTYFLGKITSDYMRNTDLITQKDSSGDNYFDIRQVEWLGEIQRELLEKSTQGTVGANNTVYLINEDAKENVLKVYRDNMDSIEHAACIIRKYLDENALADFTQPEREKMFADFKDDFSPDILENLEGEDILNKIFLHDSDKNTLCYNLEFNNEIKAGGIGGGSAFKYHLFKSSKTNQWTAGAPQKNKTLTVDEAIEFGSRIRDAIVSGARLIEKADLNTVSDYIQLENDLFEVFKKSKVKPVSAWIHKYYVLIFPDKFPEVHGNDIRDYTLRKFRIEPQNRYYANDGIYYQLAQKAGIKLYSLLHEDIVHLFFEGDSWRPIEEGRLIELEDCEYKSPKFEGKRNIIYFGAPGTGKSYELNSDKENLLKNHPDNFERVTFHPDYSYANFVGTYKPVPENNSITYKYVPGPFMRVLKNALENPNEPYILIIEEINRANVAAVFGDVFQLLDRNDSNESEYEIDTTEDMKTYITHNKIRIPQNMFIWATMNSADQGVFPMDTAFKRRWDFRYFSINHNENLIENITFKDIKWNDLRKAINDELLSYKINEDKCMGPFFAFNEFIEKDPDEKTFKDIFKNKIIMYLFEDAARSKRNDLFSGARKRNYVTYSEICEKFDEAGLEIFCDNIKNHFIDDEE